MTIQETNLGERRDDNKDSLSRFCELCLFSINESWLFEWNETDANFLSRGLVSRLLLFVLLWEHDVDDEHDLEDSSRLWLPYKVIFLKSSGPKLVWNFLTNFGVEGSDADGKDDDEFGSWVRLPLPMEVVELEEVGIEDCCLIIELPFSYIIIMVRKRSR